MKRLFILICLSLFLWTSCKEQASLEAPGVSKGTGELTDFNIEKNIRVAIYPESEVGTEKGPELTYGSMDAHFVTIDNVNYMVDWNDLEDFKNLKKNEKLYFHGTGYLARSESSGQNYRVIRLNEM